MSPSAFDVTAHTFIDVFLRHADQRGADRAYVFLASNGDEQEVITFADLACDMKAVAAALQARGQKRGERVLLLHAAGPAFVRAFLGTIYAGMVAVPAMVPRANEGTARLARIAADAGVSAVLTHDDTMERIHRMDTGFHAHLAELLVPPLSSSTAARSVSPGADEQSPAFLQYTSGSTGAPKGVVVTHANLLHNQRLIAQAFGHDERTTTVVGWLPLYHDMGLIGNVLQPLFLGRPCILMSPGDFMMRPIRWLRAIERYRATTSGGPNFAYALCTQKVSDEEAASLDLSSWRLAFNGAEPVRAATLTDFARKFATSGFPAQAFYPCYGMAESTLFVTGADHRQGARFLDKDGGALQPVSIGIADDRTPGHQQHVSCGKPFGDTLIRIVDAHSEQPCDPGQIGEIWVAGPSVAQGYYGRPDLSSSFSGSLSEHPHRSFLRTGDLGYIGEDSELFVVGRLKDMVIIRGVNYYAEDIETVVGESHTLMKGCRAAAFSVDGRTAEELVLLAEAPRRLPADASTKDIIEAIRGDIADKIGVMPTHVMLLPYGTLPLTSSGKIRRKQCREDYLAGLFADRAVAA